MKEMYHSKIEWNDRIFHETWDPDERRYEWNGDDTLELVSPVNVAGLITLREAMDSLGVDEIFVREPRHAIAWRIKRN